MLPIEFCIEGPPVSQQSRSRPRLREWKQRVREAALCAIPENAEVYCGSVRITVQHFYEGEWPVADGDNTLKPIQDALSGIVYVDDRQVVTSEFDRRRLDEPCRMPGVSAVLALSLIAGREFLHIRVDYPRDPAELRR